MNAITLVSTVVGLIIGGVAFRLSGLIWGGITGCLVGLVLSLQKRLSLLEKSHQALEVRLTGLETPRAPVTAPASPTTAPPVVLEADVPFMASESSADQDETAEPADFTFDTLKETSIPVPPDLPLPKDKPIEKPPFFERIGRLFTTTNIVVGVGLIVLFFGVAFLLKFAIDLGLISLEMRYMGVCLLGIVLLATGWLFRKRRRDFALLVQGGAVGILYMAVFSAARWHELIGLAPAFVIMAGLGVLSGLLAVTQDARGLAVLAAVGGFLAPVLTASGRPEHVLLFSYCAILGAGIFGVAFFKSWRELNLIGFGFTLVIGSMWGWQYYRPTLFSSAEFFLGLFFLMYFTISVLFAVRQPPKLKGWVDAPLVFGLPMAAFGIQACLVEHLPTSIIIHATPDQVLAGSALVLGLFYFTMAAVLRRVSYRYLDRLVEAFLAIGVLFISLAVPLAFSARWTAVSWALEGAALVWIGLRQNRKAARFFGLVLIFIAGPAAFPGVYTRRTGPPILNGWYLSYLSVAVSALFAAFHLARLRHLRRTGKGIMEILFLAYGLLWWYGGGLLEIDEYIPVLYQTNAIIAFLALSALIWSLLHHWLSWARLKYIIFGLAPILIVMVLGQFPEILMMHPFQKLGYLSWLAAFFILYLSLWRHESDLAPAWRTFQHLAVLGLTVFILSRELVWVLDAWSHGQGDWRFLGWGLGLGLAAVSVILAGRLAWPVAKNHRTYLQIGLPLLLVADMVWVVYGGFTHPGDPWPFGFLVVFNPLELGQLMIMALLWGWFILVKKDRIPYPAGLKPHTIPYLLGGAMFLMINAVPARAIHHYHQIPWLFDVLWSDMVFQAAISIFWSVLSLSLMVGATLKGRRGPWFAGGSLLTVVVVKLFLVDLSQTGTITRIVSFLAVGLLMLLIGYLSPLPPRYREDENGGQNNT